jgi:hypothetical protein
VAAGAGGAAVKSLRRYRDVPGVLLRDLPRYARALSRSGTGFSSDPQGWTSLCNRIETLTPLIGQRGYACDWKWGSALHAPQVMPALNRRLLRAAMQEWPVRFLPRPKMQSPTPRVSFVFAHGGTDRLPQLVRTLQSVFAQSIACECVVIDQSTLPLFGALPAGIVYRHLSKDGVSPGWHKAWAYNVGARIARGQILVFQDGDVCVPTEYAAELLRVLGKGEFGAASLQRLLFYLNPSDTQEIASTGVLGAHATPNMAFQNWKGGTIAVTREAFEALGGFDEGFVDWGGEDDEFYDRCASVGHCRSGFLPFVHLWHPPQPDRKSTRNPNIADVMPWRMSIPAGDRIVELQARPWGNPAGPSPARSYKDSRSPE